MHLGASYVGNGWFARGVCGYVCVGAVWPLAQVVLRRPPHERDARNLRAPLTVVALLPSACAAAMMAASSVLAVALVAGAGVTVGMLPCEMTARPRIAVLSPFHQSAPTCSLAQALLAWLGEEFLPNLVY